MISDIGQANRFRFPGSAPVDFQEQKIQKID